ncbi:MAG: hypothetical protein B7733_12755 [Myxococcales bacterium FL481]|nr:MAG: hypothetical protein B7733_12755 [Myxococcales bacterium FL481]
MPRPVAKAWVRTYARAVPNDDENSSIADGIKWALMALGAVVVAGFAIKALLPVAVVGGLGYLAYRLFAKSKALPGGGRRSLPRGDDYASKMARLDALDRKLDRDLGD